MDRLKAKFIDHILRRDCLLKHVIVGIRGEDEEEDLSNYRMTIRKRDDPSN